MTSIPAAVFDYFAADPIGPMLTVDHAANSDDHPVHSALEGFLSSIEAAAVAETCDNSQFQFFASGKTNLDREARIWVAKWQLSRCITARRLEVVRHDSTADRPRPYDQPALADLKPDQEHLVPLRDFEFDGSRLLRNGHAFLILGTCGSPNSTYWLLRACYSENLQEHAKVRLDPFLHGPAESFPALFYGMVVYGQPLDWARIESLREPEHGRWQPSAPSRQSAFTDFVWEPRSSEVHFKCEEVPPVATATYEGGRYLHALYLPSEAAIGHLDAAVRIYRESEVVERVERHNQHVRHAGKVGLREKVLRIDASVSREVLSLVCQAFFVWNEDVRRYFSVESRAPET